MSGWVKKLSARVRENSDEAAKIKVMGSDDEVRGKVMGSEYVRSKIERCRIRCDELGVKVRLEMRFEW